LVGIIYLGQVNDRCRNIHSDLGADKLVRLLSYVLGRPQMVRGDICDVAKPSSIDVKGRKNSFNMSRVVMIQLADLVSEILDKVSEIHIKFAHQGPC
jgi:hypothetical protein